MRFLLKGLRRSGTKAAETHLLTILNSVGITEAELSERVFKINFRDAPRAGPISKAKQHFWSES